MEKARNERRSRYPEMTERFKQLAQRNERLRLERAIIEAVIEEYKMERAVDTGSNTITRTEALIKMQQASKVKSAAVLALIEFEANQQQVKK